jgi:hypothetical protein
LRPLARLAARPRAETPVRGAPSPPLPGGIVRSGCWSVGCRSSVRHGLTFGLLLSGLCLYPAVENPHRLRAGAPGSSDSSVRLRRAPGEGTALVYRPRPAKVGNKCKVSRQGAKNAKETSLLALPALRLCVFGCHSSCRAGIRTQPRLLSVGFAALHLRLFTVCHSGNEQFSANPVGTEGTVSATTSAARCARHQRTLSSA